MNKSVHKKLLEINEQFYNRFATSFSNTRGRVQPGVQSLIDKIDLDSSILDIGCGNGTLARALNAKGFTGLYLGIDMSEELLSHAETRLGDIQQGGFEYRLVDLANSGWQESIPSGPYDWLTSFAVLHHLPGADFREQLVSTFADLVSDEGQVAVSVWQWQNSPRLRKRILPWSMVDLHPEELEEGDVLLDWRAGDTIGLRYVHTFDENSLTELAENAGFRVTETFFSDGKTGDLALYQVWQLADN
jgi:tRNA (uracil-5-)-methyltransferase TRM9